jgi:hypothetical protein
MTDEEAQAEADRQFESDTMLSGRGLFWCRFIGVLALVLWIIIFLAVEWYKNGGM